MTTLLRIPDLSRAVLSEHGPIVRRWLLALCLVVILGWALWRYVARPTTLSVAVGPPGSERSIFLSSIAKSLAKSKRSLRLRITNVQTGAEAAGLLNDDKVHLAVVRSDNREISDARSFAILDRRAVILIARADAKSPAKPAVSGVAIAVAEGGLPATRPPGNPGDEDEASTQATGPLSAARMLGKRIVVAADPLGSNRELIARMLAHSSLVQPAITLDEVVETEVAAAIAANRAEVAVLVVDPSSERARRLVAAIRAAFAGAIVVGGPPAPEALATIHRDVSLLDLAAGLLGGPQDLPAKKLTTVSITVELVADSDLDEATGAQLTKALLEVRGRMTADHGTTFEIEAPPLDTLRRFMPHAGVSAHVNDKSTSFLEKYSDQIWIGLFAVGLLGSSLAGWLGLRRSPPADPLAVEIEALLADIARATTIGEIEALRKRMRTLAGARLQRAIADHDDATAATHPRHWFGVLDAIAQVRAAEIAALRSAREATGP